MKENYIENGLEKYFVKLDDLANIILKNLNNKMIFEAKLKRLKVRIYRIESDKVTHGMCYTETENSLKVTLEINEKNKEEFIEIVIAHELSHLLFANFDRFGDYCESDQSFAVSSVTRNFDGKLYGAVVEEALCDYMAINFVYELHRGNIAKEELIAIYDEKMNSWKSISKNMKIIDDFIHLFSYDDDCNELGYDKLITEGDYYFPYNNFMYAACSLHMNSFITEYDRVIGKYSWKELNLMLDSVLGKVSNDETLNEINYEFERYKKRKNKDIK